MLLASGQRTGLYSSPHLCTFRERIRINGRAIGEPELLEAADVLWPAIEREEPSFFEATTAIAFEAFARSGVDVVVAEVGLGGRLDATNVLDPELAVITNIELDHVEYLGETLEAIAEEKAGIIKPGRPVLIGERRPELRAQLAATARGRGAPFHELDRSRISGIDVTLDGTALVLDAEPWGRLDLRTPLLGRHQAMNTALAVSALALLPDGLRPDAQAVRAGVEAVRWPGRAQIERVEGVTWLFDAAHNPAGVGSLLAVAAELHLPTPITAIAAVMSDKDWERMLLPLSARADTLVLTLAPSAPPGRVWDPEQAAERLRAKAGARAAIEVEHAFPEALRRAAERAAGGTVIVTGSFHTVGDALAELGRAPDGVDPALHPPARAV